MTMRAGIDAFSTQTGRDSTSPLAAPGSPSEAKLTRTTSKKHDNEGRRRPFSRAEVREEALSVFFSRQTSPVEPARLAAREKLSDAVCAWLNRVNS